MDNKQEYGVSPIYRVYQDIAYADAIEKYFREALARPLDSDRYVVANSKIKIISIVEDAKPTKE